jgi:hypothetical protein
MLFSTLPRYSHISLWYLWSLVISLWMPWHCDSLRCDFDWWMAVQGFFMLALLWSVCFGLWVLRCCTDDSWEWDPGCEDDESHSWAWANHYHGPRGQLAHFWACISGWAGKFSYSKHFGSLCLCVKVTSGSSKKILLEQTMFSPLGLHCFVCSNMLQVEPTTCNTFLLSEKCILSLFVCGSSEGGGFETGKTTAFSSSARGVCFSQRTWASWQSKWHKTHCSMFWHLSPNIVYLLIALSVYCK